MLEQGWDEGAQGFGCVAFACVGCVREKKKNVSSLKLRLRLIWGWLAGWMGGWIVVSLCDGICCGWLDQSIDPEATPPPASRAHVQRDHKSARKDEKQIKKHTRIKQISHLPPVMTPHHPNHHLFFAPVTLTFCPLTTTPQRNQKLKHLSPQHPSPQPALHRSEITLRHRARGRVLHRLVVAEERLAGLSVAEASGSEAEAWG